MPAATPSIAASSQRDSTARAMAAPTNHPAIQKVRCGTARGELRRGQAGRQAETRSQARFASLVLREAALRKKRTPQDAHRSAHALAARLHRTHKKPARERYLRSASGHSRSSEPSQLRAQLTSRAE